MLQFLKTFFVLLKKISTFIPDKQVESLKIFKKEVKKVKKVKG